MIARNLASPKVAGDGAQTLALEMVCQVRGGYVSSGSANRMSGATSLRALQPSDLAEDGSVAWDALRSVPEMRDWGRYAIREGDVLLPLRSARLAATVVANVPFDVMAVGHWALLSPDAGLLTPAYLAWYLNHPEIAPKMRSLTKGSNLQFLSLSALRSFELEVPPIAAQRRIARVYACNERLKRLERELSATRQHLIDAATMQAVRSLKTLPLDA